MKAMKRRMVVLALLAVAASEALARDPAFATVPRSDAVEITVEAKKYEFNPNVITAKQGDRVHDQVRKRCGGL
jgi:plastocyanin